MRHIAATGRHAHRRKVPLRSWLIVTLALAALAVTLAWVTSGGQAQAAPVAPAAQQAVLDRGAEFASVSNVAVILDKARLSRVAHEAAVRQAAAVLAAHTYTVRSGQSMSDVAVHRCGQARDWTGIYAASRAHGWTAKNANILRAGQHLYISCTYDPGQLRYAPAPPPPVHAVAAVATARTGGYSSYSQAPSYSGASGSMQRCIIARESGGNSQVMNSSSHYGLYQFSASTWVAHGGSAADFGHASVAEQNRVFYNTVAANGYRDWTPYDGCLWNYGHRSALY